MLLKARVERSTIKPKGLMLAACTHGFEFARGGTVGGGRWNGFHREGEKFGGIDHHQKLKSCTWSFACFLFKKSTYLSYG